MIRVSQFHIENVGPFKKQVFDFDIEKENPDIHILTGPNGSGKTSILHSIASGFDYFENNHKEHVSNLLYKRFIFFEDDKKGMAKSFAHTTLRDKFSQKIVDKIAIFGCKKCGNIHQNYEKIISNSSHISKNENNYRWESHYEGLRNYKRSIVSKNLTNKKIEFAAFGYSGYRMINSSVIQFDTEQDFNPLHLALEFVKDKNTGYLVSNWIVSRYSKAAIERTRGNEQIANKYMEGVDCLLNGLNELTNNEFSFEVKTDPWKVIINYHNNEIEFDVLPDGLRSLLSWLGDLLMRLDEIPWFDKSIPVNKQNIILLLDEIEVHLHPKWQYYILPLTRKLFPNAQIFLSTHSPFVINSIDNAKIYMLESKSGHSHIRETKLSNTGHSYEYIYENILETYNRFGTEAMNKLKRYNELEKEIIKENYSIENDFIEIIDQLKEEGEEVFDVVSSKLFRIKRVTGKDYLNGENK